MSAWPQAGAAASLQPVAPRCGLVWWRRAQSGRRPGRGQCSPHSGDAWGIARGAQLGLASRAQLITHAELSRPSRDRRAFYGLDGVDTPHAVENVNDVFTHGGCHDGQEAKYLPRDRRSSRQASGSLGLAPRVVLRGRRGRVPMGRASRPYRTRVGRRRGDFSTRGQAHRDIVPANARERCARRYPTTGAFRGSGSSGRGSGSPSGSRSPSGGSRGSSSLSGSSRGLGSGLGSRTGGRWRGCAMTRSTKLGRFVNAALRARDSCNGPGSRSTGGMP